MGGAPIVVYANKMVTRVILLCYLIMAKGAWFVLEQPLNSLMQEHTYFKLFRTHIQVYRVAFNMGSFGAESLKPTWLYSNAPWIPNVLSFKTGNLLPGHGKKVVKVHLKNGTTKVSGGKALKETQAYPVGFGRAMCRLRKQELPNARKLACASEKLISEQVPMEDVFLPGPNEHWCDHAELGKVMAALACPFWAGKL